MNMKKIDGLKKCSEDLGHNKVDRSVIETFTNQHPDMDYLIPFVCNEFTTLCPKTGQPDFAKIEIVYVADKWCLESKSLKLYLFSFRDQGNFHEDVANRIFKDLWQILKPRYMRLWADFYVRGGISIKPMILKFSKNISSSRKKEIMELAENYDRRAYFDKE